MSEEQAHGKAMKEVRDTSFKRGSKEKRLYFLESPQDSLFRPSDKSNTKIYTSEL
jgi:hypothetical protein